MKCVECDCCHKVQRTTWNKDTKQLEKQTIQQCWGVPEPFTIENVYAECTAYPPEHWKLKQDKQNSINTRNVETVVLPVSIGDCYYTKSLAFYDGIDAQGENISDIRFDVHKRIIKNRSDIYEYMMLHERGAAFLTEKEANEKIKIEL